MIQAQGNNRKINIRSVCIASLTVFSFLETAQGGPRTLSICTDQNYWYPYSFEQEGKSKGLHIDIVEQAFRNLGIKTKYEPLPWKRCLQSAEIGAYNAVVSTSYKTDREKYLIYPPDAASTEQSTWRIMQVDYVAVGIRKDPYEFNGKVDTLPPPVRAPFGYSIVDDLQKQNVRVATAHDIRTSFRDLDLSGKGVVVTSRENAEFLLDMLNLKSKMKIHPLPLSSKAYFVAFSRTRPLLSGQEITSVWEAIAAIRDNEKLMKQLLNSYP